MLQDFLETHREELLARCRAKVALRSVPRASAAELEHGLPLFLEQLIETFAAQRSASPQSMLSSAAMHGDELLRRGFTIAQVVHDYGDLCQSITELAHETGTSIEAHEFGTLNRCLDDVIAGAVTEYTSRRSVPLPVASVTDGDLRLGILAHELRNLLSGAMLSFELIKRGTVALNGATSALHARALEGLNRLVDGSLADVRLHAGVAHTRIPLSQFVEEVEIAASLQAEASGIKLTVLHPREGLAIVGDRQILAAVFANLLQNAFKFTRSNDRDHVTLRVQATESRVQFEVEDECGGLAPADMERLFQPFEQHGKDRSGLGLGLAICQRGVAANHGVLTVRTLPDRGCVFMVDLPLTETGAEGRNAAAG